MRITLQTLAAMTVLMGALSGCGSKPASETPAAGTVESQPAPATEATAEGGGGSAFGGAGEDVKERAAEKLPSAISPAAAKEFLAGHPETLLLDVREEAEWNDDVGHLDGSKLIPLGQLAERAGEIKDWLGKPIIVVCRVGARSDMAAQMLRKAGYRNVANLDGGLEAWRRAGL